MRCDLCQEESDDLEQVMSVPGVNKDGKYYCAWLCRPCRMPQCTSECESIDFTGCPRCFYETGVGCPHGPLCYDCMQEISPCEICLDLITADDVRQFVRDGAPETKDDCVPCCHLECAELEDRGLDEFGRDIPDRRVLPDLSNP